MWQNVTELKICEYCPGHGLPRLPVKEVMPVLKICDPYIKFMNVTLPNMDWMPVSFFHIGKCCYVESYWTPQTLEKLFTKNFLAFENLEILELYIFAQREYTDNLLSTMLSNVYATCKKLRKLIIFSELIIHFHRSVQNFVVTFIYFNFFPGNIRLSSDEIVPLFKELPLIENVMLRSKVLDIDHKDITILPHMKDIKLSCNLIPETEYNSLIDFLEKMPQLIYTTIAGLKEDYVLDMAKRLLDRYMPQKRNINLNSKRDDKALYCYPNREEYPETEHTPLVRLIVEQTPVGFLKRILRYTRKKYPFYHYKLVKRTITPI